ncbi:MAG: isoprenyl transferase [Nitrospirota bacterium]
MKNKNQSLEQLRLRISQDSLPKHIAIIMDGNGRWALRRGLPRISGHKKGVEAVKMVSKECRELGIPVLTLYAFSDENWGRPKEEVGFLMDMLGQYLKSEIATMKSNDIVFRTIGRVERLPETAQVWVRKAVTETSGNRGMVLNLALSYGGRGEILEAVNKMRSADVPNEITEDLFSSYLDTSGLPDPDLIIRTSGEQRISNFLLWQAAYAELYFTETLWPDFKEKDFFDAILDYQGRQRRFGLTQEQLVQK